MFRVMEGEIGQYPEAAGETMLDTIDELNRIGRPEEALDLTARIIADFPGSEYVGYAYGVRVETLFGLGRDDEAEAAIAELWERDEEARTVASLIAEFLEERGETRRALWRDDRGVEGWLAPDGVEEAGDTGDLLAAEVRARLRRRQGLAPDDIDRMAEREIGFRRDRGVEALGAAAPSPAEDRDGPVLSHVVRSDVAAAHAESLLAGFEGGEEPTPERYFRETELDRRRMRAETDFSRGPDIPLSLVEIREFAERRGTGVLTRETRDDAALDKYRRGGDFPVWPPERNQPCWCGSGRKYKKCCGRP
ncbi:SEC-C metal-binding domain-containing protein [Actinorugispora endophytica]